MRFYGSLAARKGYLAYCWKCQVNVLILSENLNYIVLDHAPITSIIEFMPENNWIVFHVFH